MEGKGNLGENLDEMLSFKKECRDATRNGVPDNEHPATQMFRVAWARRNECPLMAAWKLPLMINARIMGPKFYRFQMDWDVRFEVASDAEFRKSLKKQQKEARAQGIRMLPIETIMSRGGCFGLALVEAGKRLVVMGHIKDPSVATPGEVVDWMNDLVARSREALPPPADTAARDLFRREVIVCDGVEIGYDAFAACHEGARVTLRGLSAAELNGKTGSVVKAVDARTGRAMVKLHSGQRVVAVKVGNLTVTTPNASQRPYKRALVNLAVCSGLLRFQLESHDDLDAAGVDLIMKLLQENKVDEIPPPTAFGLVHILGVQDRSTPLEYLYCLLRPIADKLHDM